MSRRSFEHNLSPHPLRRFFSLGSMSQTEVSQEELFVGMVVQRSKFANDESQRKSSVILNIPWSAKRVHESLITRVLESPDTDLIVSTFTKRSNLDEKTLYARQQLITTYLKRHPEFRVKVLAIRSSITFYIMQFDGMISGFMNLCAVTLRCSTETDIATCLRIFQESALILPNLRLFGAHKIQFATLPAFLNDVKRFRRLETLAVSFIEHVFGQDPNVVLGINRFLRVIHNVETWHPFVLRVLKRPSSNWRLSRDVIERAKQRAILGNLDFPIKTFVGEDAFEDDVPDQVDLCESHLRHPVLTIRWFLLEVVRATRVPRTSPFHGLVQKDGDHAIVTRVVSWLGFENVRFG